MLTLARAGQAVVASSFRALQVNGRLRSTALVVPAMQERDSGSGSSLLGEAVGSAHVRERWVVLPVCREGSGVGWTAACTIAVVRVIASSALSCCSRTSARQLWKLVA